MAGQSWCQDEIEQHGGCVLSDQISMANGTTILPISCDFKGAPAIRGIDPAAERVFGLGIDYYIRRVLG